MSPRSDSIPQKHRREAPESTGKAARKPGRGLLASIIGVATNFLLVLVALPFLLLAGWGLLFDTPTLAVVAFTAAWILLPLFNRIKALMVLKLAVSFVLVPATLALAPLMIQEVDQKVEQLSRKPRGDVNAFTLQDRIGIYGLNIVMGVVGYPLYPEASRETLLMMFRSNLSGRRVYHSDFGLGSRRLRAPLREFAARLDQPDSTYPRAFGPVWVEWPRADYRLTEPEARYALALNQTRLVAKAERRGDRWMIDVRHEMKVSYPESVYVTLIGRPQLRVEEGLFWVLQRCGWLHPYTAEYRFSVYSDDPRLK